MERNKNVLSVLLSGVIFVVIKSSVVSAQDPTTTVPTTTTASLDHVCESVNHSCETCVANPKCLWCESRASKCIPFPPSPFPTSVCSLADARWGVCWLNYQILLIVMSVLAIVIILSIVICIYCCCCKIRRRFTLRREARETERENQEQQEREARHAERRAERQAKYDDIRRKYGLKKDDGTVQYNRFDNEVC